MPGDDLLERAYFVATRAVTIDAGAAAHSAGDPSPTTPSPTVDATSSNGLSTPKHWRGLATRYDKLAVSYRGGAVLAAILAWLRTPTVDRYCIERVSDPSADPVFWCTTMWPMTGPGAARNAEVETVLAVTLPEPVRGLYRESDGYFSQEGQWFVVWPLDDSSRATWTPGARGLPRSLLAFGDDGTGNPFCVDLDEPTDAVVRWNWIDLDVDYREGSMAEFRAKWLSSFGDTP